MATAVQGRKGELWAAGGSGTAMTKEACEAVGLSTTIYHVTAPAKRYLAPGTAILVYVNDVLQTSGYHIVGGCHIVFAETPGELPVTLSGAYLTPTEVTMVQNWELSIELELYDVTAMADTDRVYVSSELPNWSGSFERFYESGVGADPPPWYARAAANATPIIVRLFEDQPSGWCWTGWAVPTGWGMTVPLELVGETFQFTGTGGCVYTTDET